MDKTNRMIPYVLQVEQFLLSFHKQVFTECRHHGVTLLGSMAVASLIVENLGAAWEQGNKDILSISQGDWWKVMESHVALQLQMADAIIQSQVDSNPIDDKVIDAALAAAAHTIDSAVPNLKDEVTS